MPIKKKVKSAAKTAASRKPAKKTAKKKALKKQTPPPKKKAAKKKTVKKKTAKKPAAKRPAKKTKPAAAQVLVEPGPPPRPLPPLEEPAVREEAIGIVTHYYSHLGVAVVQINKGVLKTGDTIRVTGHTTEFTQTLGSMEYEHRHVDQAEPGQSVGIRVQDHAREHDIVYRVK